MILTPAFMSMQWKRSQRQDLLKISQGRFIIAIRASVPDHWGHWKVREEINRIRDSEKISRRSETTSTEESRRYLRGSRNHGISLEENKNYNPFIEETSYRVGFIPSSRVILIQWGVGKPGQERGKSLMCGVCWLIWYKYSDCGQLEATSVISPDKKLEKNAHSQFSPAESAGSRSAQGKHKEMKGWTVQKHSCFCLCIFHLHLPRKQRSYSPEYRKVGSLQVWSLVRYKECTKPIFVHHMKEFWVACYPNPI